MPIANTPNLNNFRPELLRQLKGLGTRQFLFPIRILHTFENSINQILLFAHLSLSAKLCLLWFDH